MIGKNVTMGRDVTIQGGGRIGPGCHIGTLSVLKWGATLTENTILGNRVFVGPYAVVLGPDFEGGDPARMTTIGAGVSIGAHTLIAHGVRICEGAIIGALSFVREDITEPGTYVGVPARRIK